MNIRILTEAEAAWLRKAWPNPDITLKAVGKKLHIAEKTATRLARDLGLGDKPGSWTRWLPEHEALVRRYHGEDLSPGDIAAKMVRAHGVSATRNTVYQKLRRLGLRPHEKPANAARRTFKPGQGSFVLPALVGGNPVQKSIEAAKANAAARQTYAEPDRPPGRRTLETLERGECKYPIGDPRHDGFSYCGCKADGDYCDDHKGVHVSHAIRARVDERIGLKKLAGGRL